MAAPTKLGKYEIRRELGKGAVGIVYEGFDPFIERTVAIKTIPKSVVDSADAQEVFSRFRREAQIAGRLTHPNIVPIYEYGEDDDMAFIVMEFVIGKELKWYFDNEERFQIKDSVHIILQLLDALDYSHSRGVVHRDIKPANILITEDARVKVADFGIARIESSHLTQVGAVLGTPNYMSPEQFTGLAVDRRSDIYSAGVILYQLLSGERPFVGSVITIMHKVLNQEPVSLTLLNPNVTKAVDEVVMKAMAKRPDSRFQSAGEFREALKLTSDIPTVPGDKVTKPEVAPMGSDATLILADSTAVLPDLAMPEVKQLQVDIEFWKGIKNSRNPDDFRLYLEKYPDGEFVELAKMRIATLDGAEIKARQEEARRKLEAEAKRKKEEEERVRRETYLAGIKAKAEAEAIRQRNAEAEEQLKKRIAAIWEDAAKTSAHENERRQQGAEAQARRAEYEAKLRAERGKKLAGLMTAKDPALDAERIRLAVSAWQLQAEKRK